MKIHDLKALTKQSRKRVGRGISAGQGKTAGRGTKGQNARTGGGVRPGFEGGQNPFMHRVPKRRGFKSRAAKTEVIHTDQLNHFKGNVTLDSLAKAGLISSTQVVVKLLNRGPISHKIALEGVEASALATASLIKAGGSLSKPAKASASKGEY